MLERIKKILPFIGYGAFYLLVFFFACYLTFPYERLKDRMLAEFAAGQKGKVGAQKLEIEELEPYWFTGVRATGVRLSIPASPKPGEPEGPPAVLEIEELRARAAIFSKLFGTTKVTFYAKAFGGELDGTFRDSSVERHLDFALHELSVGRVEMLQAFIGLPVRGVMSGKVDLTFPDKRASKADGVIDINISELTVGDGIAKLKGTLALPKMDVGELTLDAESKEGTMKLNKLTANGKDLELAAEGVMRLRDVPTESVADIYARFKFTDAYRGRNDVTKSLLGAPGSTAPALFELDPKVKQSKRSDGFYGWHMYGSLGNLKTDAYAANPPTNRLLGAGTAPTSRGKLGRRTS